jgi:uncharacterized protein DUF6941
MSTQVDYLHVCDYAFPAHGGKPCIIGIFDNITGSQFPLTHPMMSIAVQMRGASHATIQVRIELARPNGEVIAKLEGQTPASPEGGAFINLNLMNTSFPEPGRYTVKVMSGGETLATRSIRVRKLPAPATPALAH